MKTRKHIKDLLVTAFRRWTVEQEIEGGKFRIVRYTAKGNSTSKQFPDEAAADLAWAERESAPFVMKSR